MDWTEKIELGEDRKGEFIEKASGILEAWGLEMPDGNPPLLLDFGAGDFSRTGHIEYLIVNDEENGYCGKFIFMFRGQTCPAHRHEKKHETFMVLKGVITMRVNGEAREMKQGQVLKMDRKQVHTFTAQEDSLILEVSLPSIRKDNFFEDLNIGLV